MSDPTVSKPPESDKPEPLPIVAMLRRLTASIAERDAVVVANVAALARTLEGRA